jgi:hypothetical protein
MERSSDTSAASEPLSEAVAGNPIFHSTPSWGPDLTGGLSFPAGFRNPVADPDNLTNANSGYDCYIREAYHQRYTYVE